MQAPIDTVFASGPGEGLAAQGGGGLATIDGVQGRRRGAAAAG